MFCELVVTSSSCAAEAYPTAVRVASCKILTIFLRKIEKHGISLSQEQIKHIEQNQTA